MSTSAPTLVWFRQDLRLADNPTLIAAVRRGAPIIPLFILDEDSPGIRPIGGAARWWLHKGLEALRADLEKLGLHLVLRRGAAGPIIERLVEEQGVDAVYWNRLYDPASRRRDEAIKSTLKDQGRTVESFNSLLLFEPWQVKTKQGGPFQVFTPFWRAANEQVPIARPLLAPDGPLAGKTGVKSDTLADWHLLPSQPDWSGGLRSHWTAGEAAARDRANEFLDDRLDVYRQQRDRPDLDISSHLSPYLRFGEISPRQLWTATDHRTGGEITSGGAESFLRELGWREFCHHLLFHQEDLTSTPLRPEFAEFPWRHDADDLAAWQKGLTGYPIVDAGMRQLWATGWMHNRVRMVVGSMLVKQLLLPWQLGEQWFWDTLVDACPASNPASWQWVAGCGADAAPYFRIFNPILQGEKFDPKGSYVRRWVPELRDVDDQFIHQPWKAPRAAKAYPAPIVDLGSSRARALDAYASIKKSEV
jgi:deoxyribodipyrimidine photo-lyase